MGVAIRDNPDCEGCYKRMAVILCSDGMWRCANCCRADGYDQETGADLDEPGDYWHWTEDV